MEAKKALIIRIYQVLDEYSDSDNPLKQQDIINHLYSDYGIECERKAVARNISVLREIGADIKTDDSGAGCYLDSRQFEKSELRLLIDSVLCSRNINSSHSDHLIKKLIELGGRNFKSHVRHVHSVKDWDKSENRDFFLNIEIVDDAIEAGKKIEFDYNKVGLDKKLHSTGKHTASPYLMLLHNQRYYLMLRDDKYEKVSYLRLDKITNMRILDTPALPITSNEGFERGINYKQLATSLPYMYSDKPQFVTIKCPNFMMDALNDWFGSGFVAKKVDDEHFTATINVSEQAMLYWALQYNVNVEILAPQSLRQRVKDAIDEMKKMYE